MDRLGVGGITSGGNGGGCLLVPVLRLGFKAMLFVQDSVGAIVALDGSGTLTYACCILIGDSARCTRGTSGVGALKLSRNSVKDSLLSSLK